MLVSDKPPPGVGVKTVTAIVPADATSDAVIAARSVVLFTKVVVRLEPFQRTVEVLTKLDPLTVKAKALEPAVAELGEIERTMGEGFGTALTVNACVDDRPPPGAGVNTVTLEIPTAATSADEIVVESVVLLTNTVGRTDPFQRTVELLTKLVPIATNVNGASPAVAELGVIEDKTGNGFAGATMANGTPVD